MQPTPPGLRRRSSWPVRAATSADAGWPALTFVARRLATRFSFLVMPDERRVHTRPTATAGGGAMFVAFLAAMVVASQLKQFRPGVPGQLGAARCGAGGRGGRRHRPGRRPAGGEPTGQGVGPGAGGHDPVLRGITMLFFRVPIVGTTAGAVARYRPADDRVLGRRHGQRRQPHRRPRRVGGGHRRHRGGNVLRVLPPAAEGRATSAPTTRDC